MAPQKFFVLPARAPLSHISCYSLAAEQNAINNGIRAAADAFQAPHPSKNGTKLSA